MTRAALTLSLLIAVLVVAPAGAAMTVRVSHGTLTVAGGAKADRVALRLKPGAPGTLQIDLGANGSVDRAIARSRFTKIVVIGGGGADAVTLDESKGLFWSTEATKVNDGAGIDTLTIRGTQDADVLGIAPDVGHVRIQRGTAYVDAGTTERIAVLGLGGADTIQGAAGLAPLTRLTLTGGPAADHLAGGDGDDRFLWKLGDGNDVVDGDVGLDRMVVDGSSGVDEFGAAANGPRVAITEDDTGTLIDAGTIDVFDVNGLGGADSFVASGNLAALTTFDVDGGPGNDDLVGTNGIDTLRGGTGNDHLDGQQANDTMLLGAGNDTVRWDPGEGSDTFDGGGGTDLLDFFGSAAAEAYDAAANGTRLRFTRNVGNIVMDGAATERLRIHALGGADTVAVHNLGPTAVTRVDVELEGAIDSAIPDAAADTVTVEGTSAANTIGVSTTNGRVNVAGLPQAVSLAQSDAALDRLVVLGLNGADRITATFGLRALLLLTLDGAAGADRLTGGDGDDTLLGGTENDTIFGGPGNDTIDSGLGADSMTGGPGSDNYTCTTPGDSISGDGADAIPPPCP